jgi:DNA mismatch endonuclease (patch repair protein)
MPARNLKVGGNVVPYPYPASAHVTAIMRGNRSRDTRPEIQLRALLHRDGYRYRVNLPITVGGATVRVDIAFTKARLAVFVDGCFWHACPSHGRIPKANSGYWPFKLARNHARDTANRRSLESDGWRVVRIWEHVPPEQAADIVVQALSNRRLAPAGETVKRPRANPPSA